MSRQLADCADLIGGRGWSAVGQFVDNDVSAFSGSKRPSFERLVALVRAGQVDVIVAYHVDRLYRRLRDLVPLLEACEKYGTTIATVKAGELDLGTAAGRMIASILGSVSEGESARQAERIRRQKLERALAGKPNGSMRSFGYAADGTIIPEEAEVIQDVAARVLAGESIRSLVFELQQRSVPTVKGGSWRGPSLRQMLMAARLSGQREHTPVTQGRGHSNGLIVSEGTWEAILSKEDTARLRELLSDPARRTMRPGRQLLTGLLICGSCEMTMNSHADKTSGRRYQCIRIPGTNKCGRRSVSGESADAYITEVLFTAIYVDGPPSRFYRPAPSGVPVESQRAAEEIASRLRELAAAFANEHIDEEEYEGRSSQLKDRRRALLRSAMTLTPTVALATLPDHVDELRRTWQHWPVDKRRAVLCSAVGSVTLDAARPGRGPRFDTARFRISWRDGLGRYHDQPGGNHSL